jgi:cell wall-associated NlpC family hydrolase
MQEQALGTVVSADPATLKRGDLVFWKGHVAIVRGPDALLHANAYHMAVAIEPIADAVVRIRNAGSEITGIRRIVSS